MFGLGTSLLLARRGWLTTENFSSGSIASLRERLVVARSGRSLQRVSYDKPYGLGCSVHGFFRAMSRLSRRSFACD
jgi:hypothetical protein